MANNYTPPSGYASSGDIKRLQQQLNAAGANLKVDGIYGPLTDAAYKSGGTAAAAPSPFPAKQQEYMNALLSGLKSTSQDDYLSQLQAAMRPSVDAAIAARQKQTLTNRAGIDADAASRGMLGSTWVTDVKDRQQQYEADDIANMESQYNSALAGNMANYQAAALSRDDSNYWNAMQMSNSLYQNDLARQSRSGGGSGGGKKSAADLIAEMGLTKDAGNLYLELGKRKDELSKKYGADAVEEARQYYLDEYSKRYPQDGN